MKKFILKLIIFLLPLSVGLAGLEYIAFKSPNSYRYKDEFVMQHGDSIKTLILGSSHSFYGINPNFLENSSFNVANVSQDLKFDCYLLERYLKKCPNLQYVILPISYFSLSSPPLDNGEEKFRIKFYEKYMGYNDTTMNIFEKLEIYDIPIFQEKISNYFKYKFCDVKDFGFDSLGWATGYVFSKIDDNIENDAIKTIKRHTPQVGVFYVENILSLNKIAELCKNNNIKLYFITTPTLCEYHERLNSDVWNYTTSTVNEVCIKYNASYYNYIDDDRFHSDDFFDIDHLCWQGTEKFSKILNDDIFN